MQIFNIPGKLDVNWIPEVFALIDTWTNLTVNRYKSQEGPQGLQWEEVVSVNDAIGSKSMPLSFE
jgi:hypothetical protein